MMLFSAFAYLTNPEIKEGFIAMGFRDFFRIELATAKALGAIVLLLPMLPAVVKGFTYSGFAITFLSAFIAHIANGDPVFTALMPLIFLALLFFSYVYHQKLYGEERKAEPVRGL